MRRDITVIDRSKIKVGRSVISFEVEGESYNLPRINAFISGNVITVPEVIYAVSKLQDLDSDSFEIGEPYNYTYDEKDIACFGDCYRKAGNLLIFGFDKTPNIKVDSKIGAILASSSEEDEDSQRRKFKYEFGAIDGMLSLKHYSFVGDLYKACNEKDFTKAVNDRLGIDVVAFAQKYIPELFKAYPNEPKQSDYGEDVFKFLSEQQKYQWAGKEAYFICSRKQNWGRRLFC